MEDFNLSENFTFYELTKTSHKQFLEENRKVSVQEVEKLTSLAGLLETVRAIVDKPIIVHSGRRCKPLNDFIGSTDRSQHLKCEAADFSILGMNNNEAFAKIQTAALNSKIRFGQLIHERTKRSYGVTDWLHISLGYPFVLKEKSGQVLTMRNGLYEMVRTINRDAVA